MNRRDFLKGFSLGTLSLMASPSWADALTADVGSRRITVLIELKGGNDGLNTLIPYTNTTYYASRPSIALPRANVLPLSAKLAMHPSLQPLMSLWNEGELAWIQGVGYADVNRSHFESIEIWDTAQADVRVLGDGWVAQSFPKHPLAGIAIDTNLGPLYGATVSALNISDPNNFATDGSRIQALQSNLANKSLQHILTVQSRIDILSSALAEYLQSVPTPKQAFAANDLGRSLNSVYTLIASGLNTPAYKVTLNGFDTHTGHLNTHKNLLDTLAQGIAALRTNLKHVGMWDEVIVMTYSEFGRRLKENANKGIDHGSASVQMVLGGQVKGGFYGKYPSLTDLDERGDLIYNVDFRDVYTIIHNNWWNLGEKQNNKLAFI